MSLSTSLPVRSRIASLLAVAGAGLGLATPSLAAIRDTRTLTNVPSVARMGDPANFTTTITVTANYTVEFVRFGGTWGNSRNASWVREAMIRVTPPASTGAAPFVVNASGLGAPTAGVYNGFAYCPSPIPTAIGDVWTFEFFDNFDDAATIPTGTGSSFGAYDSIWATTTISLDDGPRPAFPAEIPGSNQFFATGVNSNGLFNDPNNVTLTWNNATPLTAAVPAMRITARGTALTGQSTNASITSQMSRANIFVTPPAGSGVAPFVALANPGFGSSVTVIGNSTLAGLQNGGVGDWTFQFFQSTDLTTNGTLGDETGTDAIWTNVRFELVDAQPTNEPIGTDPNTQFSASTAASGIKWYRFTLSTPISRARNNAFSIDNEGSSTAPVNDTWMGLYQGFDGFPRAADVADGSNDIAQLTFGADTRPGNTTPAAGNLYNGRDGSLAAGEYYLAVGAGGTVALPPGFGALFSIINLPAASSTNLLTNFFIDLTDSVNLPIATPPAGAVNLGQVGSTTSGQEAVRTETWTGFTQTSDVVWYRFTTSADCADQTGRYLDIDTEGTAPEITTALAPADTEIGLYAANGLMIANDDDDGSGPRSALSFGQRVPVRAPQVTGASLAGVARNGRDGVLPAGEYYLAVSFFDTTFPTLTSTTQFQITPTATPAATTGSVAVNFRSNVPAAPSCTCCNLSNVAGPDQSTTPDGALTADDVIVFLGWFFASDTRADVAGPDQSTVPDSAFTADDVIVFLGRFFAGC